MAHGLFCTLHLTYPTQLYYVNSIRISWSTEPFLKRSFSLKSFQSARYYRTSFFRMTCLNHCTLDLKIDTWRAATKLSQVDRQTDRRPINGLDPRWNYSIFHQNPLPPLPPHVHHPLGGYAITLPRRPMSNNFTTAQGPSLSFSLSLPRPNLFIRHSCLLHWKKNQLRAYKSMPEIRVNERNAGDHSLSQP